MENKNGILKNLMETMRHSIDSRKKMLTIVYPTSVLKLFEEENFFNKNGEFNQYAFNERLLKNYSKHIDEYEKKLKTDATYEVVMSFPPFSFKDIDAVFRFSRDKYAQEYNDDRCLHLAKKYKLRRCIAVKFKEKGNTFQVFGIFDNGKNGKDNGEVKKSMEEVVDLLDSLSREKYVGWCTVTDFIPDIIDDVYSWVITFTIELKKENNTIKEGSKMGKRQLNEYGSRDYTIYYSDYSTDELPTDKVFTELHEYLENDEELKEDIGFLCVGITTEEVGGEAATYDHPAYHGDEVYRYANVYEDDYNKQTINKISELLNISREDVITRLTNYVDKNWEQIIDDYNLQPTYREDWYEPDYEPEETFPSENKITLRDIVETVTDSVSRLIREGYDIYSDEANSNKEDYNPWISGDASWFNGKYHLMNYDVEINTVLSYIAIDDPTDENGGYFLQGYEADDAIKEMCLMWKNQHPEWTVEDIVSEWVDITF